MNALKQKNIMANYSGFCGQQTLAAIQAQIPEDICANLTGRQIGQIMTLVDTAYRNGKVATGADMIDDNAVWINKLNRGIEWEGEGAEYQSVTESMDGGGMRTYSVKTKSGKLVAKFID